MISDLNYAVRPIEKLEQFGSSSLGDSELLALILGVQDDTCGREVLRHFGRLSSIASADTAELAKIEGIGRAKAARIAAIFELSIRLSKEQVQESMLDSPERIYECYGPQLAHQAQERVVVATVDSRLRHLSTTTVSIGTVNECTAHPRDVMRPVITRAAHGFVLIHNHPSGDPSPSRADHAITSRIADVANTMQVRFVDHVIVGKPSPGRLPYFSFREAGQIG